MPHIRFPPNHGLSDIISSYFPPGYRGYAVDVGASDGVTVNSTYGLEKARGWRVLSVEPNPEFWPVLTVERFPFALCACSDFNGTATLTINVDGPEAYSTIGEVAKKGLDQYSEWKKIEVPVTTVEDLLCRYTFPSLDVLCVDTEGTELSVLKGANLRQWRPRVVVTECWEAEGPIDGYLSELGYQKVSRVQPETVNDLFYLQ